jgi:hypothetical protein
MGKYRVLKNSLLGGQISGDALGRTDLPQYLHSCELLQNMIPLLSGGAYRRPGTLFTDYLCANEATPNAQGTVGSHQSSPPRVFPFIVSQSLAYALVIGTDRWSVLQGAGVNPNGSDGGAYMQYYRAVGNSGTFAGSIGTGVLPYRCKSTKVAVTATDQAVYTRQGGPGAVANTGVNSAGSPATILDVPDSLQTYDDDIWSVQFCQANDVMFLTHPDYQPQVVALTAPDSFGVTPYDAGLSGLALGQSRPYLNQNTTAATMKFTFSGSGQVTGNLTSSVPFFNALHAPRTACNPEANSTPTDGAFFAIAVGEGGTMTGNNTNNGILFLQVLSVTSSTVAVCKAFNGVPSNYSSATTTPAWWESAWSNYRGWPKACAIYQQRLCLAGTIHQPNALWFTATDAFGAPSSQLTTACKFSALGDGPNQSIVAGVVVSPPVNNGNGYPVVAVSNWVYFPVDDSQGDGQSTAPLGSQPFRISLATTSLDAIQYLSPDQQLFIGTAVQEWICAPVQESFDVANSPCTIQSHYGSDNVQAIRIGYELMFVLQKKDEIRAYQYNYFDQSFFGEPVQLFFDDYPRDEEGQTTFWQNPYAGRRKYRQIDWDASRSTLWAVDTDGNLFGLTRDRKLSITTWHTHQMGGFNPANGVGNNIFDNVTGTGQFYTDSANFLCDGSVVSVCSIPNPFSGVRDLWLVIKRSYQGGTAAVYSLERMIGGNTVRQSAYSLVAPGNAQEPLYVDCAYFLTDHVDPSNFTYTVGAQLSGQTLIGTYYSEEWGMFAFAPQAPVASDGTITLPPDLPPDYGQSLPHTMVMGLGYSSIVQPVRVDPPSQIGTSQGAIKRNSKAYIRLFKTLMLKMGSPPKNGLPAVLETVRFAPGALLAQSAEIYTGDKEVFLPTNFDREGYVYIVQDQPLPFTMVSLTLEGSEYEQ